MSLLIASSCMSIHAVGGCCWWCCLFACLSAQVSCQVTLSNQKREQSKATGYLLPSILWPKLWRETNDKGLGQICNQLFCLLSQVQDSMMKRPRKTMHLVPLPQQIRRCALAFCQLITPKFFDLALAARSQDLLQSEENDQYVYIANRILLQVLLRDTE